MMDESHENSCPNIDHTAILRRPKIAKRRRPRKQIKKSSTDTSSAGSYDSIKLLDKPRVAIALHSFDAECSGDLAFSKGDLITVDAKIGVNWLRGWDTNNQIGLFPRDYIDWFSKEEQEAGETERCVARYSFHARQKGDLSFPRGSEIEILKELDENWYLGRRESVKGIFPKTYIEKLDSREQVKCVAIKSFEGSFDGDLHVEPGYIIEVLASTDDMFFGKKGEEQGLFPSHCVVIDPDSKSRVKSLSTTFSRSSCELQSSGSLNIEQTTRR
eukprot:CAMPEP_0203789550 /NCGR_PEP_ID=MMETSP0100_2-20121128/3513_1 /ASSEMBLY_ACC=CAM_ASM_000210 /TAXON_ID=96639 /ORGANISM=" , Strain NY0313808BC1" /LENGTH=271 /DNA_ID=CAMNT_0050692513 /DNA_START=75 /DNA_END=887 /DNA_ORIENTATION=+